MRIITALLLTLVCSPHSAQAWGITGHRIVAKIAEERLTPTARSAVNALLLPETMASVANWADDMRNHPDREYFDKTIPWHTVEVPDGQTYETAAHDPAGDLVTAITQMEQTLNDPSALRAQKQEALKFLIHFVGDIHQPLHVGTGLDRGANWCRVQWMGIPTNLHDVWDTKLIASTEWSYTEYATLLTARLTQETEQWEQTPLLDWVEEGQNIRASLYPTHHHNGSTPYEGHPYCAKNKEERIAADLMPQLSYDYRFQALPLLEQQLQKAGVRLAHRLNTTLR